MSQIPLLSTYSRDLYIIILFALGLFQHFNFLGQYLHFTKVCCSSISIITWGIVRAVLHSVNHSLCMPNLCNPIVAYSVLQSFEGADVQRGLKKWLLMDATVVLTLCCHGNILNGFGLSFYIAFSILKPAFTYLNSHEGIKVRTTGGKQYLIYYKAVCGFILMTRVTLNAIFNTRRDIYGVALA